MKFKIDENLPKEVAEMLRSAGHDAVTVLDQNLGGWADPGVAEVCQAEGRVVVTLDIAASQTPAAILLKAMPA